MKKIKTTFSEKIWLSRSASASCLLPAADLKLFMANDRTADRTREEFWLGNKGEVEVAERETECSNKYFTVKNWDSSHFQFGCWNWSFTHALARSLSLSCSSLIALFSLPLLRLPGRQAAPTSPVSVERQRTPQPRYVRGDHVRSHQETRRVFVIFRSGQR